MFVLSTPFYLLLFWKNVRKKLVSRFFSWSPLTQQGRKEEEENAGGRGKSP